MERLTSLEDVRDHVWSKLESAAADPDHPARTMTVATVSPTETPDLRTVVLRRTDRHERRLVFHTDDRSTKIEHLRAHPAAAWHALGPNRRRQIRLYGPATLHSEDELADELWRSEPDSRQHYRRALAPGTEVESPRSGHPATDDVRPTDEPRDHFVAVAGRIERFDWLHIHPDGDYRARFEWNAESWQGRWIVP